MVSLAANFFFVFPFVCLRGVDALFGDTFS